MPRLFVHPSDPPPADGYGVVRVAAPASDLLDASVPDWAAAAPIGWGHDRYRTTFRAIWTHEAIVVRFDCDDDGPWWTLTRRDAPLWEEEVVEIFLDPARAGRGYAEVEINPANVVCDLRVDAPWPALSSDARWDWTGLRSRVQARQAGAPGWTACAVLPFAGLAGLSEGVSRAVPPAPGDRWRFNVFRIKRPHGPASPDRDAIYAAWSVPAGPSFHDPAAFRDLTFLA